MDIAIVENNQVTRLGDYKKLFPNVSFASAGPDDAFLLSNSAYKVAVWKEYDIKSQKMISVHPYYEDGIVYTVKVVDKTEDDLVHECDLEASNVRSHRNKLLAATDWTQVKDAPVDQDLYAKYRQDLRDITAQDGFPFDVDWPTEPH